MGLPGGGGVPPIVPNSSRRRSREALGGKTAKEGVPGVDGCRQHVVGENTAAGGGGEGRGVHLHFGAFGGKGEKAEA